MAVPPLCPGDLLFLRVEGPEHRLVRSLEGVEYTHVVLVTDPAAPTIGHAIHGVWVHPLCDYLNYKGDAVTAVSVRRVAPPGSGCPPEGVAAATEMESLGAATTGKGATGGSPKYPEEHFSEYLLRAALIGVLTSPDLDRRSAARLATLLKHRDDPKDSYELFCTEAVAWAYEGARAPLAPAPPSGPLGAITPSDLRQVIANVEEDEAGRGRPASWLRALGRRILWNVVVLMRQLGPKQRLRAPLEAALDALDTVWPAEVPAPLTDTVRWRSMQSLLNSPSLLEVGVTTSGELRATFCRPPGPSTGSASPPVDPGGPDSGSASGPQG